MYLSSFNRFIKVLVSFFILLVFGMQVKAYGKENYDIDRYQVIINVNENNTYEIKEIIDVNFKVSQHGIYRNIPTFYDFKKMKVKNINVTDERGDVLEFKGENSPNEAIITIGDSDTVVDGEKTYIITYVYDMGMVQLNDKSSFHYNVIGNDWNTSIDNVNFTINMPKDFDADKVQVLSGRSDESSNYAEIQYKVEGNSIIGQSTRPLRAKEGITVKVNLKDKYFIRENRGYLDKAIFCISSIILIMILITLIKAIKIYFQYVSSKSNLIKSITFYQPKNMAPGELGYIYNRKVSAKDMISYTMYWAEKGYLDIEDNDKELRLKLKVNEINDTEYEKYLFSVISKESNNGIVNISKMKSSFGINLFKAAREMILYVGSKYNLFTNIYIRKLDKVKKDVTKLMFLLLALVYYNNTNRIVTSVVLSILAIWIGKALISKIAALLKNPIDIIMYIKNNKIIIMLIIVIAWYLFNLNNKHVTPPNYRVDNYSFKCLVYLFESLIKEGLLYIITLTFTSIINGLIGYNTLLNIVVNIGIISYIIIISLNEFVDYTFRDDESRKVYEEILGFREFLITAEKERLEILVSEDKYYVYKILPYAMVLGVSKVWLDKFKDIKIQEPSYIRTNSNKGINIEKHYNQFSHRKLKDKQVFKQTSHRASSRSFGGSTRSSYAGGGAGGGGGGSW